MAEGRRSAGRPISARRRREEAVEVVRPVEPAETGRGSKKEAAPGRFASLRDAVTGLRSRAAGGDLERWLMIAGAIAVPLGLLAILLGWQGASNTPYEFEQVPYLISGGLFGVGLLVLGGFFYFGYWLTRLVREQEAQSDRVAQALERIEQVLGGGATGNGSVRPVRSVRSASSARPSGFVATPGGSMFHRPDCVVVEGKPGLRRVTGREKGFTPCGICDPLAA